MPDPFPDNIYQFLNRHIRSIAQLELLLAMHADPERWWSVEDAAKQLYIGASMTGPLLESLQSSGLIVREHDSALRYRFAPKSDDLRELVGELARLYQERPVSTINIIYSLPTQSLKNFADAFRFRKKEDK